MSIGPEIGAYLAALEAQAKAEERGDHEGARCAATRASSLFFVMAPSVQTVAARRARDAERARTMPDHIREGKRRGALYEALRELAKVHGAADVVWMAGVLAADMAGNP